MGVGGGWHEEEVFVGDEGLAAAAFDWEERMHKAGQGGAAAVVELCLLGRV